MNNERQQFTIKIVEKSSSTPPSFLVIDMFVATGVFLIFLTLKLCGVITWSWWWVTAPLWAPCVTAFIICCVALTLAFMFLIFALMFAIVAGTIIAIFDDKPIWKS